MNADKNKQDGSFPEADEVYKAAAPRQSAAGKRVPLARHGWPSGLKYWLRTRSLGRPRF
jgi:hypothetical protein